MKNKVIISDAYKSLLLVLIISFAISLNSISQNVKVNNVKELLEAIGSDKTIELAPGTYNISEIANDIYNSSITWTDNYDGYEPHIDQIENLTIIGNNEAKIVLEPRYAWVMMFSNSNNLKFSGITFGHTEAGYCMGGVLAFESCNNIMLENCSLYGSGTVGIMTNECNNLTFLSCDIYECTYGLAYLYNTNNIKFSNCSFRKTGEYNLIEIYTCNNVEFAKCTFTNNFTSDFMPYLFAIDTNLWDEYSTEEKSEKLNSKDISIKKCVFENNQISVFTNDIKKLSLKGNKFSDNSFANPSKKTTSKGSDNSY
jgi:hypothetical protein